MPKKSVKPKFDLPPTADVLFQYLFTSKGPRRDYLRLLMPLNPENQNPLTYWIDYLLNVNQKTEAEMTELLKRYPI